MSHRQECPKCGRVFYTGGNVPRVTCHDCETAWNTDSGNSGGCGCLLLFLLLLVLSL